MLYFLDTNVLIDLATTKRSSSFFSAAFAKYPLLRHATSALAVTEFLTGAGNPEERFLSGWIGSGELEVRYFDSMELMKLTAELRREHRLKLADAAILATALSSNAHFLTGDAGLLKTAKRLMKASSPFKAI